MIKVQESQIDVGARVTWKVLLDFITKCSKPVVELVPAHLDLYCMAPSKGFL